MFHSFVHFFLFEGAWGEPECKGWLYMTCGEAPVVKPVPVAVPNVDYSGYLNSLRLQL